MQECVLSYFLFQLTIAYTMKNTVAGSVMRTN